MYRRLSISRTPRLLVCSLPVARLFAPRLFVPWMLAVRLYVVLGAVAAPWFADTTVVGQEPNQRETSSKTTAAEHEAFFETVIRPALIEHCLDCHSIENEVSGGLQLDTRAGWQAGGDSGAALVPGDPNRGTLMAALRYEDADLQMPPDGKLPNHLIDAFSKWIADGAYDPREADHAAVQAKSNSGLSVEQAQQHWAYRPITTPEIPTSPATTSTSPIDRFLNQRLLESGLTATSVADHSTLVRRLYFDLTGLSPSPRLENASQASRSVAQTNESNGDESNGDDQTGIDTDTYETLVDQLLASPHFGETFARHWMDVARYAESITLRGFVFPEAWRYRDYLIEAFNTDRPFDQMIREQITGDLLESDDLHQRQMQHVATTFLMMGNSNLEQQDKTQLEMDVIDEQLDTIGRAFLGQTIGCARCHDHKFDPIPTRDYYALAGIFRSTTALKHANLSRWIEKPLPVSESMQRHYESISQTLENVNAELALRKKSASFKLTKENRIIPLSELDGIVVDSGAAKLVGDWIHSTSVGRLIGDGYLHDGNEQKGLKTATFEPKNLPAGKYQVRLAYSAGTNRASNAVVRVFSVNEETVVRINQRQIPPEDGVWVSLGEYDFERNGQAFVIVSNENSNGYVIVDAVQFLPLSTNQNRSASQTANQPEHADRSDEQNQKQREAAENARIIADLEVERKSLMQQLAERPRYMTLEENEAPTDVAIHIRGDVHNLGDRVPRGFLTALPHCDSFAIEADTSGRLELAHWLASPENPLTARVYANRIWCALMGQGIVPSMNNFGTKGARPTHPELLDWLASELIQNHWSTKHLVRTIVMSDAYRRRLTLDDTIKNQQQQKIDPKNELYWRGHSRRLSVESLRDAMLQISGELDLTQGGSLIRRGTNADYNYHIDSPRRSLYQPVFRNALPDLFEAFDFADASVSVGQRTRSTVATQALVLMNHPWIIARARAAAAKFDALSASSTSDSSSTAELVNHIYRHCFYRLPSDVERSTCVAFLERPGDDDELDRLAMLIHSLFASLDFRYLP
ncbi:xanthan lyase [Rhodopirellula maiorica SM1]|uniref:Xanthan lyase n=1 Tax=Rhodopirellula maiorica SM1 TaxID=1265738 RepID=M5RI92_9BACT|nr:DUF1553 domain-containing protein [Rhodopirellula maiorica]EMI19015.1 xanthan lyase [Rhodopirellula maiorica SM1]